MSEIKNSGNGVPPPDCDPWSWYSDPEGNYDGATPVWIETYREWNIWDLTEIEPGAHTYGASDPNCVGKSSFYYTLSAIRAKIDDWIGVPSEGKAEIIEVSLPSELTEGSFITGHVKFKNVGTVFSRLKCLITTEWDGKKYSTIADLEPGEVHIAYIKEGTVVMPNQDAVITIEGQHLQFGEWITDDTKTH